jgi:predicted dinucleotide-binding enzyme
MSGKIIIIGAGHMGSAILRGLMHGRQQTLHVVDTRSERFHEWRQQGIACSETPPQPAAQDTLVLAIPPQVFPSFACANLALHGHRGLVISVMAGVRMQVISKVLNTPAVVRAIPNTPSEVMEGMSVCCALPTVEPTRMEQAMDLAVNKMIVWRWFRSWMNRITPCRADGMRLNAKRPHFFIRNTFSYFITTPFEIGPYLQSLDSFGPFNIRDHGFKGTQWHTSPVQADMTEQPMFNWVPF